MKTHNPKHETWNMKPETFFSVKSIIASSKLKGQKFQRFSTPLRTASNIRFCFPKKKDNFQGIQRAFFQSRKKINFPLLPLFLNINFPLAPKTWNPKLLFPSNLSSQVRNSKDKIFSTLPPLSEASQTYIISLQKKKTTF